MSIQFDIFMFHLKGMLPFIKIKNQDNSFAWSNINCPILSCFICTVDINALHEQIGA